MSSDTPAVSVIIPAYRVTEYIAEAIDSVLAQTFRDFEIVVINDGCPDTANLEAALAPYRDRIVYVKQENGGLASARNAGIRVARAPLIALLDSDDAWEPNYLEVQVGRMRADPAIDVLYADGVFFGDTPYAGQTFMSWFPSRGEVTFRSVLKRECTVFVSVTARRAAIERAGMFDPALRSAEDFDLWLRVLKNGGKIAYHTLPLIRYRARPTSLSTDPIWMAERRLEVLTKAGNLELDAAERECLNNAVAQERAELDFWSGKKALYLGNLDEARQRLSRANSHLRRRKISIILVALRFVPRLLYKFVRLRYRTEFAFMHS